MRNRSSRGSSHRAPNDGLTLMVNSPLSLKACIWSTPSASLSKPWLSAGKAALPDAPSATYNMKTGVLTIHRLQVSGLNKEYTVTLQKRAEGFIFDVVKIRKYQG